LCDASHQFGKVVGADDKAYVWCSQVLRPGSGSRSMLICFLHTTLLGQLLVGDFPWQQTMVLCRDWQGGGLRLAEHIRSDDIGVGHHTKPSHL